MLYVIILSAALDLVGPNVPKGVVLLADVIPSFGTKFVAPYLIHLVPYSVRILVCVVLSVAGMLVVALSPASTDSTAISIKLAGIVLASLASGAGELSFVGLVHFYGPFSLASWGSGTGAAGLVGAGAYAFATTTLGFDVRTTLLASACMPAVMIISFFFILPHGPLRAATFTQPGYHSLSQAEHGGEVQDVDGALGDIDPGLARQELDGLLAASAHSPVDRKLMQPDAVSSAWQHFQMNLLRAQKLFFPL